MRVPAWLILTLVAVAVALTAAIAGCSLVDDRLVRNLARWGLPDDLHRHLSELEEITLSGDVDRLDWLRRATSLRRLSLHETAVTSLSGLPPTLTALSLKDQQAMDLTGLPRNLEELRVVRTPLDGTSDLTGYTSLRSLHLEDVGLDALPELPSGLTDLAIINMGFEFDPRQLPASLRRLELDGSGLEGSEIQYLALEPGLSELSLTHTELRSLPSFSTDLRTLRLRDNQRLEPVGFPQLVVSLTLDTQGRVDAAILPRNLRHLQLIQTRIEGIVALPPRLETLTLRTQADFTDFVPHCRNLRSLELDARRVLGIERSLTACPKLERLDIFLPPSDLRLPGGLKHLVLRGVQSLDATWDETGEQTLTSLELDLFFGSGEDLNAFLERFRPNVGLSLRGIRSAQLPALPQTIERLEMNGSTLDELGELPHKLRFLDLGDCRIGRLGKLPDSLQTLDVAGSNIQLDKIEPLPDLEELVINPGQLKRFDGKFQRLRVLRIEKSSTTDLERFRQALEVDQGDAPSSPSPSSAGASRAAAASSS